MRVALFSGLLFGFILSALMTTASCSCGPGDDGIPVSPGSYTNQERVHTLVVGSDNVVRDSFMSGRFSYEIEYAYRPRD